MKFEEVLLESYQKARLKYSGSRPNYKIHDPEPAIIILDDNYNPDGHGDSVLGINLNYIKDKDIDDLIKAVDKADNKAGFRGFETKMKIKRFFAKDKQKHAEEEVSERIRRYKNFIKKFPFMGEFIRRYKKSAIVYRKRY
jgi:hypothetical protein